MTQITMMDGMVISPRARHLECKVKWALRSITRNKASGDDRIPAELFQILKDNAVKVLHSKCQQIWKTAVAIGLEKVSFHSIPKKVNVKECSNYYTIALILHTSKLMFKNQKYQNSWILNPLICYGVVHWISLLAGSTSWVSTNPGSSIDPELVRSEVDGT